MELDVYLLSEKVNSWVEKHVHSIDMRSVSFWMETSCLQYWFYVEFNVGEKLLIQNSEGPIHVSIVPRVLSRAPNREQDPELVK